MHPVSTDVLVERAGKDRVFDEAQLAAASFLARYSAQTVDAYRHDLRSFFNWAATCGLEVLTPPGRTSNCTVTTWNNAAWPPRRSTGDCRRCAGYPASLPSTGGSPPTQPNTSVSARAVSPPWLTMTTTGCYLKSESAAGDRHPPSRTLRSRPTYTNRLTVPNQATPEAYVVKRGCPVPRSPARSLADGSEDLGATLTGSTC